MRRYSIVALALTVLVLGLVWASEAYAQRYVDVPAGYGTLHAILSADSANRIANPNTIYRLHRGTADSVYILSTTLTITDPVQIESAGSGMLPTIFIATLGDGTPISPMISVKANFRMKGVNVRGINTLGASCDRLMRIQKTGIRLELDSCFVTRATQSFIRVDNAPSGIFLKNCRMSNSFSDWANGRGIDNRGVAIDTLSMQNCSFWRLGQRAYRDGGGTIRNAFINHCTFVDIAGPVVSLGLDSNLVFTNNLIYNCQFLGDSSTTARMIGMTARPSGQSAYVANNVFYTDSAKLRAAFNDSVKFVKWFADTLDAFIAEDGTGGTNIHSQVTFTMPPDNVPGAVKVDSITHWYWLNQPTSSANASILAVDTLGAGLVNLAYNSDAVAYKWPSDGTPAGSLEWMGIPLVGVEREPGESLPAQFALSQNYPNPFNPSTRIGYSIVKATQVRLEIFNLLGQSVRILADMPQEPGTYSVVWDGHDGAGKLMPSGVYFYRLQAEGAPLTKKMMLTK